MTQDRRPRLEELFHGCLEIDEGQRAAWLDEHCGDDPVLRAEIADLLERDARTGSHTPAPVLRFEADPLPDVIGPYRLGEKLGEGGFGEVFAAEQLSPVQRPVALKVLKPGMDSRAVLARFSAERQTLARMDHPGIARIFDAGVEPGGRPFFVMERVDGEPITAFCDHHRLGVQERVRLMIEVCRAVEHAHQKGIIHRDLKPSNLLVTRTDGRPAPRIIDFGIAKATGSDAEPDTLITRQGEFLGTPEYASPEQTDSGGANVDTRTDVYALGAVLYRLLTGLPLYDPGRLRAVGLAERARILRTEDPQRPSDRVSVGEATEPAAARPVRARDLRGDLDWITLRAVERDRSRRYPSAAALAEDLERYLHDEPVAAGPPSASYRLGKFARRHRAAVIGGAAVLLTLVVGLLATLGQSQRAREAEREARREATIANAVSTFLVRMLAAADPERNPRGADLTVREVVDGASRELDAAPSASPDIEAAMRHTLGTTYMGIGLYESAAPQLRRAAELRERLSGPASAAALESRLALVELAIRQGAYPAAESLLAGLGPRIDALDDAGDALRVRYLRRRGDNMTNLGFNDAADSLLTSAVARARGSAPADSNVLAGALIDLARLRSRVGQIAAAESLSRESVDIFLRTRPGGDHDVASALASRGEVLRIGGQYAAAESVYAVALEMERRVLGPRHPAVAYALTNRAISLVELGRFEEAERCHREGLALLREALGDDHPEVVVVQGNLATVLQSRGAFDEALALRRQVLANVKRLRGENHADVPSAHNNLGSLYRLMGRYAEAETSFREAIAGFRRIFGEAHPLLAVATHNLGRTQLDRHQPAEAEATIREALAIGAQVFPEGHVNLAIFASNHARALSEIGRQAEAERELLPAHERIVTTFGPAHPRSKETALELSKLYARWGRTDEAARWSALAARLGPAANAVP